MIKKDTTVETVDLILHIRSDKMNTDDELLTVEKEKLFKAIDDNFEELTNRVGEMHMKHIQSFFMDFCRLPRYERTNTRIWELLSNEFEIKQGEIK